MKREVMAVLWLESTPKGLLTNYGQRKTKAQPRQASQQVRKALPLLGGIHQWNGWLRGFTSDSRAVEVQGQPPQLRKSEISYGGNNEMKKDEATREYQCGLYVIDAHPRSCFFCDHCTDIFCEWSGKPYKLICNKGHESDDGIQGKCKDFQESDTNERNIL